MFKDLILINECRSLAKKLCGRSPKIKFGNSAYFEIEQKYISLIKNEPEDISTIASRKFFKKFLNFELSIFTYTILHELGHFQTCTEEIIEEYLNEPISYELVYNGLVESGLFNIDDVFEMYYAEPVEKIANDQMKEWFNQHKEIIIEFDERIKRLQ